MTDWVLVLLMARYTFTGEPWLEERITFPSQATCESARDGARFANDSELVALCAPAAGTPSYAPGCRPCAECQPCPPAVEPAPCPPVVELRIDANGDGVVGMPEHAMWTRLQEEARSLGLLPPVEVTP